MGPGDGSWAGAGGLGVQQKGGCGRRGERASAHIGAGANMAEWEQEAMRRGEVLGAVPVPGSSLREWQCHGKGTPLWDLCLRGREGDHRERRMWALGTQSRLRFCVALKGAASPISTDAADKVKQLYQC